MRLPDAEVSLMDTVEAQEEFRTVVARLASSPALWVSAADVTITSIVAGSVLVTATVQLPTHDQVEALTQPGSDPGLSPRQQQAWVVKCFAGCASLFSRGLWGWQRSAALRRRCWKLRP